MQKVMITMPGDLLPALDAFTKKKGNRRGDVVLLPFPYLLDYRQPKMRPGVITHNGVANRHSPTIIGAPISALLPSERYLVDC